MAFRIKLSTWLLTGIITMSCSALVALALFLIQHETFFPIFFPFLTMGIMALAMRGAPAEGIELILILVLGIGLQLLMYFVIGSILGAIIQKVENRIIRISIVLLTLLLIPGIIIKTTIEEREWHRTTFHVGYSPEDCEKESSPAEQSNCYGNIFESLPPSLELCNKIFVGDSDYYNCARYLGEKSGNIELCNGLEDQAAIDSCVASIPKYSKTDEICVQIKDERIKDFCLYNAGIASHHYDYCLKINEVDSTAWWTITECAFSIGIQDVFSCLDKKDKAQCMIEICEAIPNEKAGSQCYLNVAAQLEDSTYCNLIDDPDDQAKCHTFMVENSYGIGESVIFKVL